ncbi:MAG: ribonuclease H-like YkuK family protein [Syntrophomonadaceae bacterium]|jgi:predicted RNase H-related nuclease YkuK (DUF458 family)
MLFCSPSKGNMELQEVAADIIYYISQDMTRSYKLLVGSDSHVNRHGVCFVTAIIVHRVGRGARYYYQKTSDRKIKNMKQRIFYEASLSLALADQLMIILKQLGQEDMKVEIHMDVGTNGDTKELVKEITGMIIGCGFDAKIKPDACAASQVADRYTK